MLEIKLQPICYECKDIDAKVSTQRLYCGGNEAVEADCTITCTHADVCKKLKPERVFSIGWINYLFPHRVDKHLQNWGALEEYKGKIYTHQEINKFISDLFLKEPYIEGACYVEIIFIWQEKDVQGIHHSISFSNYQYKEEKPDKTIQLQYRG